MRRTTWTAAIATLSLGLFASPAWAQSNGGGNSADAPGQARAAANCVNVWGNRQADLVAGGGPKSAVIESLGTTSAPTNCDHFWQSEGVVGNG
jgi:hypothetical protein